MVMTTSIEPILATSPATNTPQTSQQIHRFSPCTLAASASWALAGWSSFVFLSSLPYKFSGHTTTHHIFTTIGEWIGTTLNPGMGATFSRVGAAGVGTLELITALVLLLPVFLWSYKAAVKRTVGPSRSLLHAVGGLLTVALMAGAVFFHLATPLGVQVVVDRVSDGGSLFRTALSVLFAGILLVVINRHALQTR